MPSATRNTNANSGNPGSDPAKPKTYSNSSAEMPRAAPKDRTTVPIRISGAATARSRPIRIRNTTTRTIGMITLLSRLEATLVSR